MRIKSEKSNKNKKAVITFYILVGLLFFYVTSTIMPPLFHKKVESVAAIDYGNEDTARERIRLLDDNKEALLWRLKLIESAEYNIIMSTFDFRDDRSGLDIMSALNEAAGRGVKVKILVDGIAGQLRLKNSNSFKEMTKNKNVEVKFYNNISMLTPWKGNYRMHDKYLIADNKAFILGGRNTFDLFLGDYNTSRNEDRDILVYETAEGKGNSYIQLVNYFNEIWESDSCKTYTGSGTKDEHLQNHYIKMKVRYKELQEETDWLSETIATDGIALLSNATNAWNKEPILWKQIMAVIETHSEATMISPYIVLSNTMYGDIKDLVKKGTDISIITNAYESGANPFGCTDYMNEKDEILNTGVRVYEYWGSHSLHTKTILVGDDISIIGSFNMDMRSTYLNTELMLCIKSSELNEELKEKAQTQIDQSKCVEKGKEDFYGKDYETKEISREKKIRYEILRRFIRPFRQLL